MRAFGNQLYFQGIRSKGRDEKKLELNENSIDMNLRKS